MDVSQVTLHNKAAVIAKLQFVYYDDKGEKFHLDGSHGITVGTSVTLDPGQFGVPTGAEFSVYAFVVWGAELADQAYCSVGSDNISGGRRATAHLARLGRQRIVFLGDLDPPEAMQRQRGYVEALEAARRHYPELLDCWSRDRRFVVSGELERRGHRQSDPAPD